MSSRILASLVLLACSAAAEKRPLTHQDYDQWRSIRTPALSNDGKYLAYAMFPQEGDGQIVIRNLATGKERREPIGEAPPPPPPNFANPAAEEEAPRARSITMLFSHDNRRLVFSTFAARAEVEKAKRDKKKPDEMPKGGMVIIDLASGHTVRIARVKSFQIPKDSDGALAYLREADNVAPDTAEAKPTRRKPVYGGDLMIRNLVSNQERSFPGVVEYLLTKDGGALVYAVSSKNQDTNGVFAVTPNDNAAPKMLLGGKGKYSKLAWDEEQKRLAFVSDHDGEARFKLYLWDRGSPTAAELASTAEPGYMISDRAPVAFSKDGERIFLGVAPIPPRAREASNTPADDRVSVDLWHWKDDYIQPRQKVRAELERTRSFRAVYHLPEKKFVQLADASMSEVSPNESGLYALGGDDREYRSMVEYDEHYVDSYLVDTRTGSRKLLAKKHLGTVTWSPDGKYALFFNGKDWVTLSVPDGLTTNLTAKLGVRFWEEDHDTPGSARPYGLAGWTKDGAWVLVNDHYDVWQIRPDGSRALNLTLGSGRKERLMFRYVKIDPEEKAIDSSKPLLLHAENNDTHDTGFYTASLNAAAAPAKLRMEARNFTNPIKAKNADVYVLTASAFSEFPDLFVTDRGFRELRKVSDANPQQKDFLWGSAELVHFRNADGVPLTAALYKPENFDPKKKYPLIVYIYERLSQNINHYVPPAPGHSINITYYVSNGYLVMTPDIVYQIGYPGQSALKCVLPAVQELVDRGIVDEKAIGIQGHSWGGYQIAYMITQTNRFRAVAAGAVVANMISAYDGIRWGPGLPRQFQYERTQSRIGGSLWQYPLRYIENSPVLMADRVNTPLLMIHNDADDAVPWYQGIEYYLALRRLGKEVYMFTYNGEPHGLRRRPNQKDYTVRLQQYFDHYLKGAPAPDWMEHGIPYIDKPGVAIDEP
jgi:dipeptidyl aminopeptidase/acylaminoacyl peptidase